ncbi:hypothetical protein ACWEO2_43725 [Nocardia sp. NPDC004278]
METSKTDKDLWSAVVVAEQQANNVRAEFYRNAGSRVDIVSAALRDYRERDAALLFLQMIPEDVPRLLDQLIDLAMSPRWALSARRAIAGNKSDAVVHAVRQLVDTRLHAADADDYRRLAELLLNLNDMPALRALTERAAKSDNAGIREVGEDFSRMH